MIRVLSILAILTAVPALAEGPTSYLGNTTISQISQDPKKPVSRGYIVPTVEKTANGFRLSVEIFQDRLNSGVALTLQAAINDGKGNTEIIPLKILCKEEKDNPKLYYSKRTYDLTFRELNSVLSKYAPNAKNVRIGPGTALFVYARFETGHQWGGVDRGGLFFVPEDPNAPVAAIDPNAKTRRPSELDIAYTITEAMALPFNSSKGKKGLLVDGQIRSRLETEGKFQVVVGEESEIKKALFELANNKSKATRLLGADWTLELEQRYLQKDSKGKLILGADGLPMPDPMVDTYYDNDKLEAAKNDMAIRYRFTKGNNSGSWNFKPGLTKSSKEGLVDRIEYGVDATDDKPETIKKFADSMHPLNPFKIIREKVKGATPSDFLKPSVIVTDHRYKFMLKHKNGLAIEVSLDEVEAKSVRKNQGFGKVRYTQVEMDVDHLATQSTNVAQGASGLGTGELKEFKSFLSKLSGKAFLDGRPVMHNELDLADDSAVKKAHQDDFKLAQEAVVQIRDKVLGKSWLPAPQKYALAASLLQLFSYSESSSSVQKLETLLDKQQTAGEGEGYRSIFLISGLGKCAKVFD